MDQIVLQPTKEICDASKLLNEVINRFLNARSTLPELGRYESEIESINLMNLIIRNVEGVSLLAQNDLVLFPAAMTLARTAFETAIRLLWIIAPDEPFQREVRWLAHLKGEENFYERFAKRISELGVSNFEILKTRQQISNFREGVENLLPENYPPLNQIPDLAAMMKSLKKDEKYLAYIVLSQFAHGCHNATGLFRKNLGNKKEFGEFIKPDDWRFPLSICWFSLHSAGCQILNKLGGNSEKFLNEDFAIKVQKVIDAI